jgi:hypothetical protein
LPLLLAPKLERRTVRAPSEIADEGRVGWSARVPGRGRQPEGDARVHRGRGSGFGSEQAKRRHSVRTRDGAEMLDGPGGRGVMVRSTKGDQERAGLGSQDASSPARAHGAGRGGSPTDCCAAPLLPFSSRLSRARPSTFVSDRRPSLHHYPPVASSCSRAVNTTRRDPARTCHTRALTSLSGRGASRACSPPSASASRAYRLCFPRPTSTSPPLSPSFL